MRIRVLFRFVCFVFLVPLLFSCKSRERIVEIPVEVVKERLSVQRDSVFVHDSTFVKQYISGDTVFNELVKWRTKYVDRLRVDTAYVEKPVTITVTETKEVERNLRWYEQALMAFGAVFLLGIGIFMAYKITRNQL